MSIRFIKTALAAAVLATMAAPAGLQAAEDPFPLGGYSLIGSGNLYATGPDVFIQFLGFAAQYKDEISFRYDLTYGGTSYYDIFNNKTAVANTVWRINDFVEVDQGVAFAFAEGDNVIFSLYVSPTGSGSELGTGDFGQTYYTNNGMNADGEIHSRTGEYMGTGAYTPMAGAITGGLARTVEFNRQVGFEDRLAGDWDFNDVVFAAQGVDAQVPEPMSMLLMATGLFGICGVAYRRKETDDNEA